MLLTAATSCVVLVDFQHRLMPAIHQGDQVLSRSARLGHIAKLLQIPVIGTEQLPAKLGPNTKDIAALCDITLEKHHFGACQGSLLQALPDHRPNIVIAGCEAHVCLLQTALRLLGHGYRVWVVADAIGSRAPSDRELALQRLRQEGARIVSVEMAAFEWLESAEHPLFREVLALIK
ncbi:MAG: isochorismatase family protein [Marinobacter sp.]|nr:isochorismatase family protein [Marinobacter sp.]